MAGATEPFDSTTAKHCPSNGRYYFCERIGENGEPIRFPTNRALRVQPFEWPVGAKAGPWMIRYSKDEHGAEVVPHVAGKPQVIGYLSYPSEVCDQPEGALDADILSALAKETPPEDDEEGSLKATRIEAKKREIALDLANKQDKLLRRTSRSKELTEGFMLNREHRLEVRAQSEAMFRLQNQSVVMMERTFVLMEKMQEVFGRFAELEKTAAQKIATPPPPIDYTPVFGSVVSAIRDIGVSALQRDQKPKLKPDEESSPVKAALAERSPDAGQAEASTPKLRSATQADLLARVERMQAERDRLKSELEAERNRQRVLDESRSGASRTVRPFDKTAEHTPAPTRDAAQRIAAPRSLESSGSPFYRRASRNSACPCGSGRRYRQCCLYKDRQADLAKSNDRSGGAKRVAAPSRSVQKRSVAPAAQTTKVTPKLQTERPGSAPPPNVSATAPAEPLSKQRPAVPGPSHAAPVSGTPHPASESNDSEAEANTASQANATPSQPATAAGQESEQPALPLPSGMVSSEMQEVLVNMLAGKLMEDPDAPIPPPMVSQVAELDRVLVAPPKMDPETAHKLLKDGTALEAFGAFLFFNPAIRTMLLSRRGK